MDTARVLALLEAGDWQAAHEIVQKEKSTLAAWLHGIAPRSGSSPAPTR
jgi:hypothetical protein